MKRFLVVVLTVFFGMAFLPGCDAESSKSGETTPAPTSIRPAFKLDDLPLNSNMNRLTNYATLDGIVYYTNGTVGIPYKKPKADKDAGTIVGNTGYKVSEFMIENGWIYYLSAKNTMNKTNIDDHSKTKSFVMENAINSWIACGDKIYYTASDGDTVWVYDQSKKTTAALNKEPIGIEKIVQIYDKYLYLLSKDGTNYSVCRIDTQTGQATNLNVDLAYSSAFMVRGDYIVYSLPGSGSLLIQKVNGEKPKTITESLYRANQFSMDENGVYWRDGKNNVYVFDYDTYESERLYTADNQVLFAHQINSYIKQYASDNDEHSGVVHVVGTPTPTPDRTVITVDYKTNEPIVFQADPDSPYAPLTARFASQLDKYGKYLLNAEDTQRDITTLRGKIVILRKGQGGEWKVEGNAFGDECPLTDHGMLALNPDDVDYVVYLDITQEKYGTYVDRDNNTVGNAYKVIVNGSIYEMSSGEIVDRFEYSGYPPSQTTQEGDVSDYPTEKIYDHLMALWGYE